MSAASKFATCALFVLSLVLNVVTLTMLHATCAKLREQDAKIAKCYDEHEFLENGWRECCVGIDSQMTSVYYCIDELWSDPYPDLTTDELLTVYAAHKTEIDTFRREELGEAFEFANAVKEWMRHTGLWNQAEAN